MIYASALRGLSGMAGCLTTGSEGPPLGRRQGLHVELPVVHLLWINFLQEELTDLVLPCHVSGMEKPLALGISGQPLELQVTISVSIVESDER